MGHGGEADTSALVGQGSWGETLASTRSRSRDLSWVGTGQLRRPQKGLVSGLPSGNHQRSKSGSGEVVLLSEVGWAEGPCLMGSQT